MGLGPTRRDVLKGGAAVLGAGVAQGLFSDSLLHAMTAEAACGQLTDIEHVVIFINENRSFDHYFGTYPTVRGFADPNALPGVFAQSFPQAAAPGVGDPLLPFHLVTNPPTARGECTNDISHEWNDQHVYWDNGLMDKWAAQHIAVNGPQTGPLCMGYYTRDDLTYFYALADAFTICDSYFCSVLGPTDPNRLMSMTGSIDPLGTNGGPSTTTLVSNRGSKFGKYTWPTFPEQLQKHGISWKVYGNPDGNLGDNVLAYFPAYGYNNPDPSNPYYANAFMPTFIRGSATDNFKLDAMNGTLPQVSWVLASLVDSEHPPAPVEGGELALLDVVNALTASPLWPKTALFYTYDENGGFFDHLPPPTAPAGTFAEYIPTALANSLNRVPGPVGLGFRVPMLIISPFSRGGYVSSDVFDHTSLLRFIETRFGVPIPMATSTTAGLSDWRRAAVGDMTSAFNFAAPDKSVPTLPTPSPSDPAIVADPNCLTGTVGLIVPEAGPTTSPYPLPAQQSMPQVTTQPPRRPSGVCAATTSPSPSPLAIPAILPNTASGLSTGLAALLGGLALAGAWWVRRVAAPELDGPGSIGAGKAPPP